MQVLTPMRASKLPPRVLQLTAEYMTPNEIVCFAGTCRRFRSELQKPTYWSETVKQLNLPGNAPFNEYIGLLDSNLEYLKDPDFVETLPVPQQAEILFFLTHYNSINNIQTQASKRALVLESALVRQLTSDAMSQVRSLQSSELAIGALNTLGELEQFTRLWIDHMLGVYMGSINMGSLDPYAYFHGSTLHTDKFEIFLSQLTAHLRAETQEIKKIFPENVFKETWEALATRIDNEVLFKLTNYLCEASLDFVPSIFICLQTYFTDLLELCPESSEDFLGAPFAPWVEKCIKNQAAQFREISEAKVKEHEIKLNQIEQENEQFLWSNVARTSEKTNFLSSFKRALWVGETPDLETDLSTDAATSLASPTTEAEAQVAVLLSKVKGIQSLLNLELVLALIDMVKNSFTQLRKFSVLKGSVADAAREEMKALFIDLVRVAGTEHTEMGFNKAIEILNEYNPKQHRRLITAESSGDQAVEPLALFAELINVSDLMLQTLHVFFQQELVQPRIIDPNDFASPVINCKRKYEQMIDNKVAEGLNRGVDVLLDQVDFIFMTEQLGSDFNPFPGTLAELGPTTAAKDVVALIKTHVGQLSRSLDKSVMEVFEHEAGMRLWSSLCKHIKRNVVSINGAITLISDVNYYHAYILSLKQRQLYPYYDALKEVAQLYLISPEDSKQLGNAISDMNRFRGVMPSDELLEFMKSRADWAQIKHKVEKVLYGFGECVVQ